MVVILATGTTSAKLTYPIVDTGQVHCYDERWEIEFPQTGESLFGQDAQYSANNALYRDNDDGTISDLVTGLMWQQDPGNKMTFDQAVSGAVKCRTGGYNDWRLPNAKELQSIIDYGRSPDTTDSAAIDPIFDATPIINEAGKKDFAQYWTSSSHLSTRGADTAIYFAFGRSLGWMADRRSGEYRLLDVHGTGSQRSDPKMGDASRFPHGRGPQGDVIRIENLVRLVRGGHVETVSSGPKIEERLQQAREGPRSNDIENQRGGRLNQGNRRQGYFMERFDKDADGKVTRDEFDDPSEHFRELDKNSDETISHNEAPHGPPPGGGRPDR